MATAAASAAVVGGVLPKVLSAAGLDEAEVRAGLAIFRAAFTILGLRAVAKSPGSVRGQVDHKAAKDYLKHIRMREGNAAEAGRAYPHRQIYVQKAKGKGHWGLDYYDPVSGEIASFKDTQLANIKLKTAIGYLNELKRKYAPGRTIGDVPSSKGIAGDKRVIIVSTAGGQHAGQPTAAAHEDYLKFVLGFVGIRNVEVVHAHGLAMGDDARADALRSGRERIRSLFETAAA